MIMKEENGTHDLAGTTSNPPNQTIMWLCYAFYKMYQVISLGMVTTYILVRRNETNDEEN